MVESSSALLLLLLLLLLLELLRSRGASVGTSDASFASATAGVSCTMMCG
jgi:hypothetical protein